MGVTAMTLDKLPLDQLTEDQRHGAMVAIAHVKKLGAQMERNAKNDSIVGARASERAQLTIGGRMVIASANIVRRGLTGNLPPHHFRD